MKHIFSQGIVSFSILLFLSVFIVLEVHAKEEKCIDVSGRWESTQEIDATACGGTKTTRKFTYELIQDGCIVTVKGSEQKGEVIGNNIHWPQYSFPGSRGGTVTQEAGVAEVIENRATDKGTWSWTDGTNNCSGTISRTEIKLPDNKTESATVDPSALHRDRITADVLFADTYKGDSPVQNVYFMPLKDAGPAFHTLSGTLSIEPTKMSHRLIWASENVGSFPALKINFFTYKEHLVPVDRNKLLMGEGSTWKIILASGRIWSEPDDNGYSRASFPFTLIPSSSNFGQTHNGIATFLFNEKRVSQLRFQIVQEAAPEEIFDAWGQAGMKYLPSSLQDQIVLAKQFAKELAHQTPVRAWAELEQTYDPIMLDMIDETNNRENITLSGLIIDDAVYARPCRTRWGDYPYCDQMRHGVYSISKSLGAMLAMLRLAEKYGDDVFDLKIKDYVDIASKHDGWREVTFGDTLNMATGIGDIEPRQVSDYVSEDSTALARKVFRTQSTNEKLKLITAFGNYPWGPGEVFRYRTSDTFVLAAAMDRFIKSKEGQNADLWSFITREVFQPIGIAHMPVLHTIEPNRARGIPMLGIGMFPTLGEVAKLVKLLRNGGQHKGEQILSEKMLNKAIGKAMSPGLPTGWQLDDGETYYNMSLWLHPYRAKNDCFLKIPAMSGHGGSYVIIMPNGITAFRFADGRENSPGTYDSSGLRKVADYIRPFCDESAN